MDGTGGGMRWGQQIGPQAYALAVEQQGVSADAVWRYRESKVRATSVRDIRSTCLSG